MPRASLSDGANRYTIRFAPDSMPPAKQFWSITMYNLPARLLVANPINRYLLNTPMRSKWVKDADGGLTFYIQHESPGKDKEPNWLPAPKGPFYMVMRLYLPSQGGPGRHVESAEADQSRLETARRQAEREMNHECTNTMLLAASVALTLTGCSAPPPSRRPAQLQVSPTSTELSSHRGTGAPDV